MSEDWLRLIAEEKSEDVSKNDNGRLSIILEINTILQQVFRYGLVQPTEYCIGIDGMIMLLYARSSTSEK